MLIGVDRAEQEHFNGQFYIRNMDIQLFSALHVTLPCEVTAAAFGEELCDWLFVRLRAYIPRQGEFNVRYLPQQSIRESGSIGVDFSDMGGGPIDATVSYSK